MFLRIYIPEKAINMPFPALDEIAGQSFATGRAWMRSKNLPYARRPSNDWFFHRWNPNNGIKKNDACAFPQIGGCVFITGNPGRNGPRR
jgi:hypothetical protein